MMGSQILRLICVDFPRCNTPPPHYCAEERHRALSAPGDQAMRLRRACASLALECVYWSSSSPTRLGPEARCSAAQQRVMYS